MRVASQLYRLALRAFPARHRVSYTDEMVDAFERARERQRRDHGRWRASQFVVAAGVDAIRAGVSERRRHSVHGRARGPRLGSAARDLSHAIRSLAKARVFTCVSVISLGIGLGTVITILLFLRVVIGAPPGVTQDGFVELIVIPQDSLRAQADDWAIDTWSYPDFEEVRGADTGMTIAAWTPGAGILRAPNAVPGRVDAMYVSPNYFPVVGVALARGAGFTQRDSAGQPEVIISHRAWQRRLGADPDIVGRTIVVNGTPHVVVGVTPDGFRGHLAQHRPGFELWLPLSQHPRLSGPASLRFSRAVDWVQVVGRLSSATSRVQAHGVVSSIMADVAQRHPTTNALKSASVEPYSPTVARRRRDTMTEALFLVGAASLVLVVVCLNMFGMVLVRSATRERELAVRLAMGASRWRLMQYLLSESVVLALLGGALVSAVLFGVPAALALWAGVDLDEFGQMTLDAPMVAGLGLCLAASLVFGLLPAIRFSRPRVMAALKDETGGGGRRVGRIHRWTVAVQAGLAVPFLVVCGVQLDQFRKSALADLGFDPVGLFAVPLDLSASTRAGGDAAFVLRTVQSHLEQASGVSSVSVANGLPLDAQPRITHVARNGAPAPIRVRTVTRVLPGYFETMGVRIARGRGITADDRAGSEPVVLISQALASRLFPDGEPVGQRLTFALDGAQAAPDVRWQQRSAPASAQTFTVIGVTEDLVDAWLGPPQPQLFVPLAQHPATHVYVLARSAAALQTMTAAVGPSSRSSRCARSNEAAGQLIGQYTNT